MLSLPKTKRDPKKTADLCKCRPVCAHRRREWRGALQQTSAELPLERRPPRDCVRRWPTKVYPNSLCPLFARTRHVTLQERHVSPAPRVARVCQAPVDDAIDTPYLRLAQVVVDLGAMNAVKSRCPFCECRGCCGCRARDYAPTSEARDARDMRDYDARVRRDCQPMRIMYR